MELLRIRRLFERLDVGSLVVLDELCSGTNPSEGEEIARLAHEPPFPALAFLQVELDAQQRPTYRFVPGVARTSLAQQTAARLGVTREELLERIAAKRRGRV